MNAQLTLIEKSINEEGGYGICRFQVSFPGTGFTCGDIISVTTDLATAQSIEDGATINLTENE